MQDLFDEVMSWPVQHGMDEAVDAEFVKKVELLITNRIENVIKPDFKRQRLPVVKFAFANLGDKTLGGYDPEKNMIFFNTPSLYNTSRRKMRGQIIDLYTAIEHEYRHSIQYAFFKEIKKGCKRGKLSKKAIQYANYLHPAEKGKIEFINMLVRDLLIKELTLKRDSTYINAIKFFDTLMPNKIDTKPIETIINNDDNYWSTLYELDAREYQLKRVTVLHTFSIFHSDTFKLQPQKQKLGGRQITYPVVSTEKELETRCDDLRKVNSNSHTLIDFYRSLGKNMKSINVDDIINYADKLGTHSDAKVGATLTVFAMTPETIPLIHGKQNEISEKLTQKGFQLAPHMMETAIKISKTFNLQYLSEFINKIESEGDNGDIENH